jgi:hypothetical protein
MLDAPSVQLRQPWHGPDEIAGRMIASAEDVGEL